jgi:hypothetical protein
MIFKDVLQSTSTQAASRKGFYTVSSFTIPSLMSSDFILPICKLKKYQEYNPKKFVS